MRPLVILTALLALAPPAPVDGPSPEVRKTLAAWTEGMNGLSTLRVEFTQTKRLRVLRRPRVSQGVALLVGERVRLTTSRGGAVESELIVGPDDVRIHYPRLKRLEIYPRRGGSGMPFPVFGGDVDRLAEDHDLRLDAGALVLVPRDAKAAYAEARVTLVPVAEGAKGLRVAKMIQKGRRGEVVEMTITRWVANPELKVEAVTLVVPEGTETVRLGR